MRRTRLHRTAAISSRVVDEGVQVLLVELLERAYSLVGVALMADNLVNWEAKGYNLHRHQARNEPAPIISQTFNP